MPCVSYVENKMFDLIWKNMYWCNISVTITVVGAGLCSITMGKKWIVALENVPANGSENDMAVWETDNDTSSNFTHSKFGAISTQDWCILVTSSTYFVNYIYRIIYIYHNIS